MEEKQTTLTNHLQKITNDNELQQIIKDIVNCSQSIYDMIRKQPDIQSQQEVIKDEDKLDEKANTFLLDYFSNQSQSVTAITTIKSPNVKDINSGKQYVIAFDSLDGQSNIEANIAVGTIFSVYRKIEGKKTKSCFRSAKSIVLSGYIMYSNILQLCVCVDNVNLFAFDEEINEYILYKENLQIQEQGNTYCINECYANVWYPVIQEYIDELKNEHQYDMRYSGTLVADFHRVLSYGGIYCYPTDKKQRTGKLKLVYECMPLAYIISKAGGEAISNLQNTPTILETKVDDINSRSGIIIGSKFEIDTFQEVQTRVEEESKNNQNTINPENFLKV